WRHTDYDFENPSTDLAAQTNGLVSVSENSKFEFYDYPGEYRVKNDGESLVKLRMEEEERRFDVVEGTSHCRSFSPGSKFKLEKHHVKGEAGKGYVITSVQHIADIGGAYVVGGAHSETIYQNSFECIP